MINVEIQDLTPNSFLIRQVTNHPPDIMIEKWLYNDYPELRPYQKKSIEKQLNESVAGLKDSMKQNYSQDNPGCIQHNELCILPVAGASLRNKLHPSLQQHSLYKQRQGTGSIYRKRIHQQPRGRRSHGKQVGRVPGVKELVQVERF